jgi:parvulin-like peptidyl-prolyl isomerase
LAKPNYSFEKRQREIAKKKEKDAKDARKREAREAAKPASGADEGAAADDNAESSSNA